MFVGRHRKEALVNREARINEQNRLRIGRFGRGKHAIAVVESAGFAAFAHAHGFRSELHMRGARHVFGVGSTRHKARGQASRNDGFARRARVDHKHAHGTSRTHLDQAFQRLGCRVNGRRFLLARERVDALCGRSRGRSGHIANGHICRFLRTQHNCTLSLRTNLLHARTCSMLIAFSRFRAPLLRTAFAGQDALAQDDLAAKVVGKHLNFDVART